MALACLQQARSQMAGLEQPSSALRSRQSSASTGGRGRQQRRRWCASNSRPAIQPHFLRLSCVIKLSPHLLVHVPILAACFRQAAARLPRRQRRSVAAAAAAATDAPPRRVVVTGQGVVSSLGHDPDEFYNNLLAGKSGVSMIEGWDTCKWL